MTASHRRRAARIGLQRPHRDRVGRRHRENAASYRESHLGGSGVSTSAPTRTRCTPPLGGRCSPGTSTGERRFIARRQPPEPRLLHRRKVPPRATPWPTWRRHRRAAVRRPPDRPSRTPHRHRPWLPGLVRVAAGRAPLRHRRQDGFVRVWDWRTGQLIIERHVAPMHISDLEYTGDGQRLVIVEQKAPPMPSTPRHWNPTAHPSQSIQIVKVYASPTTTPLSSSPTGRFSLVNLDNGRVIHEGEAPAASRRVLP